MLADQEEIARLDVQVLQAVLVVHQVQHFGRLAQVAQQLGARHARLALLTVIEQHFVQVLVGQLGDDHQLAGAALDAVDGEQKRVANVLDALDGLQLGVGLRSFALDVIEVAVDELDGFEQAAGGLALPHFAEAAAAQGCDQSIAGNGFCVDLFGEWHPGDPRHECHCVGRSGRTEGVASPRGRTRGESAAWSRCQSVGYVWGTVQLGGRRRKHSNPKRERGRPSLTLRVGENPRRYRLVRGATGVEITGLGAR